MQKAPVFKGLLIFFLFIESFSTSSKAQENKPEKDFTPYGKTIITIFSDIQANLRDQSLPIGFDIGRCYLGYRYRLTPECSAQVIYDIRNTLSGNMTPERSAFVKNAFVQWKKNRWSIAGGLLGMEMFRVQEKCWGYRYVRKSFQDEYNYGYSTDLGMVVKYAFNDWFSADGSFSNGEGYKNLNRDRQFRYGIGLDFRASEQLCFRLYADRSDVPDGKQGKSQYDLALFGAYQKDRYAVGVECDFLVNAQYVEAYQASGLSAYAKCFLGEKWEFFGRYDLSSSNRIQNLIPEEQVLVAGMQYAFLREIAFAPNIQVHLPRKKGDTSLSVGISMRCAL